MDGWIDTHSCRQAGRQAGEANANYLMGLGEGEGKVR